MHTYTSKDLWVGVFISPTGEVTYRGMNKDNYVNNYDGSKNKFFVWPAFSNKP
jgi:hypothetical protein